MSTSYLAIAVDPERVWRAWGSNDQELLERVLDEGDEILEQLFDLEAAKAPDPKTALAAFIAGTPPHQAWVHHNALIVSALAAVLGDELPSDGWQAANADFVEEVGKVIAAQGVPLDVWALLSSEPPASIPTRSPYRPANSNLGFLGAAAVAAVAPALKKLRTPRDTDEYVEAAIADLRAWFATAAKRKTGLFCLQC